MSLSDAIRTSKSWKTLALVLVLTGILGSMVWHLLPDPSQPTVEWIRWENATWLKLHEQYGAELEEIRKSKTKLDFIMYGDSITESWRGLQYGHPIARAEGIMEVWKKQIEPKYDALSLGISSDRTLELKWRLLFGESPIGVDTKVIVLFIGTNNIGHQKNHRSMEAATRRAEDELLEIVQLLHRDVPKARILLMATLPRGDRFDPAHKFDQPSRFTEEVDAYNRYQQQLAKRLEFVSFVDCGEPFVSGDGKRVLEALMPDALHPNDKGMAFIAECLSHSLDMILKGSGHA